MRRPLTEQAFQKQVIRGIRSLWDTFYWIDAALARHVKEFKAQPDVARALSDRPGRRLDVIARMERLRNEAERLKTDLLSSRKSDLRNWRGGTNFEDLSPEETAALARMDKQLQNLGRHLHVTAKRLEHDLSTQCQDPANEMGDYEVDIEIDFQLREDDPGFSDEGDVDLTVASIEIGAECCTSQWEHYEDLTVPHGGVFHNLRYHGGYEMSKIDYHDMLRIGKVFADIIVRYQFYYDPTSGEWFKHITWRSEGDGNNSTST